MILEHFGIMAFCWCRGISFCYESMMHAMSVHFDINRKDDLLS
jgi:hypothetical protein